MKLETIVQGQDFVVSEADSPLMERTSQNLFCDPGKYDEDYNSMSPEDRVEYVLKKLFGMIISKTASMAAIQTYLKYANTDGGNVVNLQIGDLGD